MKTQLKNLLPGQKFTFNGIRYELVSQHKLAWIVNEKGEKFYLFPSVTVEVIEG